MQCEMGKGNVRQGKAQALNLKTGGNSYMQCSGAKGKYRQVKYKW